MTDTNITLDTRLNLDAGGKLYKYGKRVHIERTAQYGEIRIGTLFDYRREERFGTAIGDSQEGYTEIYDKVDKYDFSEPEKLPKIAHEFFHIPKGLKNSFVENVNLMLKRQSKNYYLFCLSKAFKKELLIEFKCEAVYSIIKPFKFFHEINIVLNDLGLARGRMFIMPCIYMPRKMHHTSKEADLAPVLIKHPKYAKQEEVRVIWTPTYSEISPVIIACPQIGKYIHLEESK